MIFHHPFITEGELELENEGKMGSMSMVIAMTTGRRAESGNNKMSLDLLLSCPG